MDAELTAALEPVLRDLAADAVPVRIVDEVWADQPSAMLYDPDGFGMGIRVPPGLPHAVQIAEVADQVQEWAVEALWFAGRPTNWPRCPRHPQTHPLMAAEQGGQAYWKCPARDELISEIGRAGATGAG